MPQSQVCQPAGTTYVTFGFAKRSQMGMVIITVVLLPQSPKTILLPDAKWRHFRWPPQHCFELFIVANKQMTHLVPRHLCTVAAATFCWMTSFNLQLRISSSLLGQNWMTMPRCSEISYAASWWRKQASNSSKWTIKGWVSDHSDMLNSS